MSNDLGNLVNSTLMWGAVQDVSASLGPILNLSRNFGDDRSDLGVNRQARPGSTITIKDPRQKSEPYDVDFSDKAYAKPQDIEFQPDITVELPKDAIATSHRITEPEYLTLISNPGDGANYQTVLNQVKENMTKGLKLAIIKQFMAEVTAANFSEKSSIPAGAFDRAAEIDLDTKFFERGVEDSTQADVILHPRAYGEWVKDHLGLHANTGKGVSSNLLRGGHESVNSGFTFWRSGLELPADAPRGFVFNRNAMLFVARAPVEPKVQGAGGALTQVVTDKDYGLPFLFRIWQSPSHGWVQMDLSIICKFQAFQPEFLERITE